MPYTPINFQNLPSTATPLSAANLAHLQTQYQESKSYTDSLVSANRVSVSVLQFGASNVGTVDATSAVQDAINSLPSTGGAILFPPGVYLIRGYLRLPSNVTVTGPGAVIKKDASSVEPVFAALGGAGSVENIRISNLRFQGALPDIGVNVFWGHRASNVVIDSVVVDGAIANGHVADLQGCTGVLIENSVFRGSAATEARGFTEAVQIDSSVRSGAPVATTTETYDGTPTTQVTVRNCRFEKFGSYNAPRPIGAHSVVQNKWYKDILFEGNYVERPNVRTTGNLRACINFMGVENVTVRGNTFVLEGASDVTNTVQFHPVTEWTTLATVNNTTPSVVSATNTMKGYVLSVSRNSTDSPAITPVAGNFYEVPFTDTTNFSSYSGPLIRVSVIDGFVNCDGVIKCDTAGYIEGTTRRVFANLPEVLRPWRDQQYVRPGSGTATWTFEMQGNGDMSAARFNTTQPAGVWLPISVQWPLR